MRRHPQSQQPLAAPPTSPPRPPASTGLSSSAPPASTKQKTFIVWQPTAFTGEAALVASEPIDAWKDLLAYHLIEAYAAATSKALADERFAFFGTTLSGATQQRPRDFRGDVLVSATLGDAVGQLYVKRFFSPEAKAQAEAIVANLIAAFRVRLENITWMAPATKKEALTKLGTLQVSIGYPDHWRSYAGYEVTPDNLFANLWERQPLRVPLLPQPHRQTNVDRSEWCMTPQTVNAVNLPLDNGLNFPAAILQPPFFDPKAPAAAQLRRHRHRHRPRDQPHLRLRGRRLRLHGPRPQLVDPRRPRPLQDRHRRPRRAVRHLHTLPRPRTSTAARPSAKTSPT